MKNIRCDAVVVQILATEYDAVGRPIGETALPPAKLFRAGTRDFWAFIDQTLDQAKKQAQANSAPPQDVQPPTKKGGKRR